MATRIQFQGREKEVAEIFMRHLGVEKELAEAITQDGFFDDGDAAKLAREWKRIWIFPTERSLANTLGARFASAEVVQECGIDDDYREDFFEDLLEDVFEEAAEFYAGGEESVIEGKGDRSSGDELWKLGTLFEAYANEKYVEIYGTGRKKIGLVGEEMFEQIENFVEGAKIQIRPSNSAGGNVTAGTLTLRIEKIPMAPPPIFDLLYHQIVKAPHFAPALYRKVVDVTQKVGPKEGRVIMVELNLHPIVATLLKALGRGYPKSYLQIKSIELPHQGFEISIEQVKYTQEQRKQYHLEDLGEEEMNFMKGFFRVAANGDGYDLVFELSADPNVPFPQKLVEWEPAPGSIPATMREAVLQVSKYLSSTHYFENCLRQQLRLAREGKRTNCYK